MEYFAEIYVNDILSMETFRRGNESRFKLATRFVISDHLRMFGDLRKNPAPFIARTNLTFWAVCQGALGFDTDTRRRTMKLPGGKRSKKVGLRCGRFYSRSCQSIPGVC